MEHQRKTDWGALRDTAQRIDELLNRGAVIPARKALDCLRDQMQAEAEDDIDGIADNVKTAKGIHRAAIAQDDHLMEGAASRGGAPNYDQRNVLDTIRAGGYIWGACHRDRGFSFSGPDQYGRYYVQPSAREGTLCYVYWLRQSRRGRG